MEFGPSFDERPFVAIWETMQAYDLAGVHYRAAAQPGSSPLELDTGEAKRLIDQIADLQVSAFVLKGGDPLRRSDIFDLVQYASEQGLRTSLALSATPRLTCESIAQLTRCGLGRLELSLDGPTAKIQDGFRRLAGSYEWTLNAVRWAREIDLPVQINTAITRRNLDLLDDTIALLEKLKVTMWNVLFPVPTGGEPSVDLITDEEFERVFDKLYQTSLRVLFDIRCVEAQHYSRFLLQRRRESNGQQQHPASAGHRMPQFLTMGMMTPGAIGHPLRGINAGKGLVFISHGGDVYPSAFLPVSAGNLRSQSLKNIYRDSPLFRGLRDSKNLQGKCGRCEFREVCGGSRARAYAATGEMFAEEPCCVYEPRRQETP